MWKDDTGAWEEVRNEVTFQGLELTIGPRWGGQTSVGFVEFSPLTNQVASETKLRVIVQGTLREGDMTPQTDAIAYVDIGLED